MAFSLLTRPFRSARPAPSARARLGALLLEDRCTPTASLITTNASIGASGNGTGDTILAQSRDGRYVVVSSTSTNLVANQVDTTGTADLFWFDTASGERHLLTAMTGSGGTQALGTAGTQAVISADGQFVAFVSRSQASFLDPTIPAAGDAGSFTDDIFRWSHAAALTDPNTATTLMSKETATKAFGATVPSANPAISNDGSVVAFTSTRDASAVDSKVVDNADKSVDLFAFSDSAGTTAHLISYANTNDAVGFYTLGGTTTIVNDVQVDPNGRYMDSSGRVFTFITGMSPDVIGTGLLPYANTAKNARDVYLATFGTAGGFGGAPTLQLVSSIASDVTRAIGVSNGRASSAILAPDNPSVVVFTATTASGKLNELVTGYLNNNAGKDDLYLRVMNSSGGLATHLITATNGTNNIGANGVLDVSGSGFDVSADGGKVVFSSAATNIITTQTDNNNAADVFAWDFATGLNTGVSTNSVNSTGTAASNNPRVSTDGRYVSFESTSANLVGIADTNGASDVFVRDLQTGKLSVASAIANGTQTGNAASSGGRVAGTGAGARVVFQSAATNLDPNFVTPAGQVNGYSAVLPIVNSGAGAFAAVSGSANANASFASFDNAGHMTVGDKFTPFPGFSGELRVAVGDVNGDGVLDMVVGAGPGGGPRVVVIDGALGTQTKSFFAFESTFTGGVYVATADLNGDGKSEIIVGAGEGGGPRVRIFDGATGATYADLFIYESTFRGGVRVAAGDVNGDGVPDLITGAGIGGGPRVTVTSGKTLGGANTRIADFFAFENSLRNGVNVSAGDFNNDGKADLGIGAGPGGGPRVTVFDGADVLTGNPAPTQLLNFFAFDPNERNGVRVALKDIDGDSIADVLTGEGAGGPSLIRTFAGGHFSSPGVPAVIDSFFLYGDVGGTLGTWVG
jgi:hypothetical protein